MNKLILISVFAVLIIGTSSAYAHELLAYFPKNTMMQTATFIPQPFTNSYFTLEKFERHGQSHWYTFTAREGDQITIMALVPDIPTSRDFVPSFDLLFQDGQKLGKVIAPTEQTPFFEDQTGSNWFVTAQLNLILTEEGIYFIRAHDELHNYHIGDTGKFSLAVGNQENLTFAERIQTPFWILLVNLFFENNVFVWVILTLLFIGLAMIFLMIHRRGKK